MPKPLMRAVPKSLRERTRPVPAPTKRLRFVYEDIGASARYRADHQIEQARIAGLEVDNAPFKGRLDPYDLAACDLLYLYRLPLAPRTLPLIAAARRRRIPVVFDTDDLVWDPADRWYSYLDNYYPTLTIARILFYIYRTKVMMRYANALVLSTPYLARLAAGALDRPAFINPNAVSQAMLQAADVARAQRAASRTNSSPVVIGYFSGTPRAHEADLASISSALCSVLDDYPDVRLRIYGGVQIKGELARPAYASRIEHRPLVGWDELLGHVAQVDITIAPLVDNPQRRSKSAVKYLESALVGVPTVAARLDPYQDEIAHGVNGLLAWAPEEWVRALAALIQSAELRQQLGDTARANVLARHTTAVRAANFASIIAEVIS